MIEMSCDTHDKYAANSQFITHLMGRILGQQGLESTPIDTRGRWVWDIPWSRSTLFMEVLVGGDRFSECAQAGG